LGYRDVRRGPDRRSRGLTLRVWAISPQPATPALKAWPGLMLWYVASGGWVWPREQRLDQTDIAIAQI